MCGMQVPWEDGKVSSRADQNRGVSGPSPHSPGQLGADPGPGDPMKLRGPQLHTSRSPRKPKDQGECLREHLLGVISPKRAPGCDPASCNRCAGSLEQIQVSFVSRWGKFPAKITQGGPASWKLTPNPKPDFSAQHNPSCLGPLSLGFGFWGWSLRLPLGSGGGPAASGRVARRDLGVLAALTTMPCAEADPCPTAQNKASAQTCVAFGGHILAPEHVQQGSVSAGPALMAIWRLVTRGSVSPAR